MNFFERYYKYLDNLKGGFITVSCKADRVLFA